MLKPIKVIAVDTLATAATGVMEVEQVLKSGGAPSWKKIFFGEVGHDDEKLLDLVEKLSKLAGDIATLEIVAEGTPAAIDSLEVDAGFDSTVVDFAANLKQDVAGMSHATKIYLSGCNTGLANFQVTAADDIAQQLANVVSVTTYGAKGYISGAHALGNEMVKFPFHDDPADNGGIAGGVNETGNKCWKRCKPKTHVHLAKQMLAPAPPQRRAFADLTPDQVNGVLKDVGCAPLADAPTFRVGAERRIRIPDASGADKIYHVIANGAFLRHGETYQIWRNSQGRSLLSLQAAAPSIAPLAPLQTVP